MSETTTHRVAAMEAEVVRARAMVEVAEQERDAARETLAKVRRSLTEQGEIWANAEWQTPCLTEREKGFAAGHEAALAVAGQRLLAFARHPQFEAVSDDH